MRSIALLFSLLLLTPSSASINLLRHASVSTSSPRRRPSRSSMVSSRRSNSFQGQSSTTTAFIDPSTIMSTIDSFYKNQRYTSAFVTGAVKGVAADLVAQSSTKTHRSSEEKLRGGAEVAVRSFDLKRNVAFLLYGGIYQGMGLEYIYNTLMPNLFGESIALKVLFTMFVVSPFLTLPAAYLFKALVFSTSATAALRQYWHDIVHKGLLKTYWKIWIPVQTLAFAFVPEHLRISFIAAISFGWMILFSTISSK